MATQADATRQSIIKASFIILLPREYMLDIYFPIDIIVTKE